MQGQMFASLDRKSLCFRLYTNVLNFIHFNKDIKQSKNNMIIQYKLYKIEKIVET